MSSSVDYNIQTWRFEYFWSICVVIVLLESCNKRSLIVGCCLSADESLRCETDGAYQLCVTRTAKEINTVVRSGRMRGGKFGNFEVIRFSTHRKI